MRQKTKTLLYLYALAATVVAGVMTYNTLELLDVVENQEPIPEYTTPTTTDPYAEIEQRPEFKEWVELQKRSLYWREVRDKADYELEQIEKEKLENEEIRAAKVEAYLNKRNPALAQYAREIAQLPRYLDVLAIAYQETKLCTVGVGEPGKNNCGGIKSHRADRTFKVYDNPLDSLEDISYLLHEPHLVGKTIDEMNGTYCVDEANGGGVCPEWAQNIKSEIAVILES